MPNFVNFYHTVNYMSMLRMFQHMGTIFRVKDIHSENGDHIAEQNGSSKCGKNLESKTQMSDKGYISNNKNLVNEDTNKHKYHYSKQNKIRTHSTISGNVWSYYIWMTLDRCYKNS